MPNPKFAIAVANFIVLVPTFFTIFAGIKADKTVHKARWLIHFGYLQALLFVLVAFMTRSSSYLAFFSRLLDEYSFRYHQRLPQRPANADFERMFQNDLWKPSFTQLISFLCSLAGQALGVWLFNRQPARLFPKALVNALTFLLSSTILYLVRRRLTHNPVAISEKAPLKEELKKMYTSSKLIFEQEGSTIFSNSLAQILIVNAMAGSLIALYNLYLLDNPIFQLSFSQSLLVLQTTLVLAMIAASLTPNDYFSRLSLINQLTLWATLTMILLAVSNFLHLPVFVGIAFGFLLAYISGKINPKINTLLLSKLSSDVLAQTSSFLSLLFSLPLWYYNLLCSLALWNMNASWLIFSIIVIALLLSIEKKKDVNERW